MGSKLTLHCQGLPSWTGNFLTRAKADYVKCIGNYISHPTAKTIGRVYVDQGKVDTYVMGGANGADGIFGEVWAEVQKNPHVWIWETPANEASIWNGSVAANFVAFNQRLIQRFHDAGKRICVGAINVGWPRLPSEDGGAMMTLIYNAAKGADGLSFHEYGWDDMRKGATFYCLRYRRFHDFCVNRGYSHPPIYITECGIDRTSPPGPDFGHAGWRVVLNNNEAAYLEQLLWYETEMRKDSYVKAATIFTAGPSGWNSFEMYEGISMKLADKLAALGPTDGDDDKPPPDDDDYTPGQLRYCDRNGQEIGESAWKAVYGDSVQVKVPSGSKLQAVEIWDSGDNAGLDCQVYIKGGYGGGERLMRLDGGLHAGTNKGDYWETVFDAGYGPPNKGAYSVYVDPGPSDVVAGLGWLYNTNHRHPQRIVYVRKTDPQPQPPPVPGNVQASDGTYADRVTVTWTASTGATVYEVHRATSASGTKSKIGSSTGLSFSDTTATPGTTYWYWAKACNANGCSAFAGGDSGWRKQEGPPPDYALGIDVSSYQADISWDAIKAAGVKFAFIRASAGLVPDAKFARNWEEAGRVGILRGAYHYLRQEDPGQARCFVDSIGGRKLELGCWADIEQPGLAADKCEQFLTATDGLTTHTTGVYTRASFFNAYGTPDWAQGRLLWVAHWDATTPTLPKAWTAWTFWQHTNQGQVDGQRVDLDRYNGTVEQLYAQYGPPPGPEENKPPVASFTFTADDLTVQFDATESYDPDGQIVNYGWSFGDGMTGDGERTTRIYAEAGTYDVTLTVVDGKGAEGVVIKTIVVGEPEPEPDIEEAKRLIGEADALLAEAQEILEALS